MTFKSKSALLLTSVCTLAVCPWAPAQEDLNVTFEVPRFPMAPPETTVARVSNHDAADPGAIDKFAWKTFIALNWPALDPAKNNNVRGIPDLKQDFLTASPQTLTVWETLKEKREVFNPTALELSKDKKAFRALPSQPEAAIASAWNSPVHNGELRDASGEKPPTKDKNNTGRVLSSMTKMPSHYNGLDETIEVLAQDLNPADAKENPTDPKKPRTTPYGMAVAPRVWLGQPAHDHPVLYEVKVNYDFFRYVAKYGLTNDETAAEQAKLSKIRLPFRTTAASQGTKNQERVLNYSVANTHQAYQTANNSPDPSVAPPRIGAFQLKAAWIRLNDKPLDQLTPAELKAISKYHLTTADYYKTVTVNGKITPVATPATFGLVGLHIIQRVHFNIGKKARPEGGSFVFATWEHIGNDDPGKYTYCNFFDQEKNGVKSPATGWYPHEKDDVWKPVGIPVVRRKDAVLPITTKVNKAVHAQLKGSVWENYRLIGTQFLPIDLNALYTDAPADVFPYPPSDPAKNIADPKKATAARQKVYDPTNIGQNAFLANLVLETSHGLQNFQGRPPNIGGMGGKFIADKAEDAGIEVNKLIKFTRSPVPKSSRPRPEPNPQGPQYPYNTVFNSGPANMGGCMGCHGVAQIQGYSFSFVLLGGKEGAKTDTQTHFDLPLSNEASKE